jgi:AraC-like DNA-binding protein
MEVIQTPKEYREERFEYALYINEFVICKRNFRIDNFIEDSMSTINFKNTVDSIVRMIDEDLKSKTRIYTWYYWDENKDLYYVDNSLEEQLAEPWESTFKFVITDNKREVFSKIWDGRYYPRAVRDKVDLSNKIVFHNTETLELFKEIQNLKKISNFSDDICYEVAPILFKILCVLATNNTNQITISKTAKLTKRYIDESIHSNTSLEDIANMLNLSKAHIIREFTKNYGISPYNYLIEQKIATAKKMLILHNMNVNEISSQLGFEDSNYFSKLFKKKTGVSPLQYRKSKISNCD